jgi:hypothetical protein
MRFEIETLFLLKILRGAFFTFHLSFSTYHSIPRNCYGQTHARRTTVLNGNRDVRRCVRARACANDGVSKRVCTNGNTIWIENPRRGI